MSQVYTHHVITARLRPPPRQQPGVKVGPNSPCPCGSGKKYKNCHQRVALPGMPPWHDDDERGQGKPQDYRPPVLTDPIVARELATGCRTS